MVVDPLADSEGAKNADKLTGVLQLTILLCLEAAPLGPAGHDEVDEALEAGVAEPPPKEMAVECCAA